MLFRRRTPPTRWERLRLAFWPRESWQRSFRYFSKRILRLSASPHAIGLGFAAGVLVSFTPFVGFHFLMAGLLALIFGGNILASAIGTLVGNPVTFPFLWWGAYTVGRNILGIDPVALKFSEIMRRFHEQAFEQVLPVLKPMLVGAFPLGLASATVAYFIIRFSVSGYQAARRRRLAARRDARTDVAAPIVSEPGVGPS